MKGRTAILIVTVAGKKGPKMKPRNILLILATLLLALALSMVALAEPPAPGTADVTLAGTVASKISYQGRLTDAGGNPLTGSYNLVFQLWDDATAGSQVGSNIVRNNVSVNNGLFTVDLDVPQSAFNGQALWLRIQVSGQWLSPRQELLPVPYALGLRPGAWINGDTTGAVVTVTNEALDLALYAQGAAMGVRGVGMTGVSGYGQVGVGGEGLTGVSGAGSWVGVYGDSAEGYGVRGSTSAPMTATVAGVYGSGDNAIGVMGTSLNSLGGLFTSTHGTGASVETLEGYGLNVQSGDNIGIYAHSGRWTHPIYWFGHIGVFGNAEEGTGVQGMGQTGGYFSGQQGVQASGTITGVIGTADNTGGRGVIGIADNYSGIGVYGSGGFGVGVQGNGEIGVKGIGSVGYGVWGEGPTGVYGTSTSGYGVWGTSTNGTAVFGEGRTGVKGTSSTAYGDGVEGEGPSGVYGRSTSADGCGGCFVNLDGGIALYAYGNGGAASRAALRVDNSKGGDGMAAYLTNNSGYANAHLQNFGNGEVLVLQSNGGQFLRAVTANWTPKFRLQYDGIGRAANSWQGGGADFAEMLPAADGLQAGDVLVIGPDGTLVLSSESYQTSVAGVYSTQPGFVGGQPVEGEVIGAIPLAVVGVVPVKVSAENGPIRPGDLLVTSSTPGYAMKAGPNPPQGTVIGKALEKLDQGTGVIKMLATLQ